MKIPVKIKKLEERLIIKEEAKRKAVNDQRYELAAKERDACLVLKERIKQVDAELIQMKSNLNAVHGAIQQVDKLIKMSEESTKLPDEKEKALNIATS